MIKRRTANAPLAVDDQLVAALYLQSGKCSVVY
jgi:myosin-5